MSAIKLARRIVKAKTRFSLKFWRVLMRLIYSAEFSENCEIGKNVILSHNALGCMLSAKKIGDNTNIYQNVTLGIKGNGKGGRPTIEENCIIYAGAVIVGDITIGANSIVGANAVVLEDVPPNSIVGGVPARVLKVREMPVEKSKNK